MNNPHPDVFFFEAFEEEERFIRSHLPSRISAGFTWKTIQEQGEDHPPAPIVSIRTQSILPPTWAKSMRAILTRSTGYDHLHRYLADTGASIDCGYLPLYCARAVAEQALLLWMALLRKLSMQTRSLSTFRRDGLTGLECAGKNLLVVGVGHIGYEIVRIGRGLDMRVKGVDIIKRHADVDYTDSESGLPEADIVVCAMNLTSDNAGYFDSTTLRRMKPGAIFINIARGELSPLVDLLAALDENHLGGVGLDVYNHESELAVTLRSGRLSVDPEVAAALDLSRRDRAILTPHNAFNTVESVDRKARQSVEQLEQYLNHGRFKWPLPESHQTPCP